ncbi:MAG: chlorophyll A-B binding protein [Cyanobacteria bacterium]|nr:chlorophyll A-B binding protein [Cyanobacteria bacterium GSL.Bin1]
MMEENRNDFKFGFNTSAENWNGRLAMIGFISAILIELLSGQGVLHFWGLL